MRRLKSTTWTLKAFANATLPPFPSPDRRTQNKPSILILCSTFARGSLTLPSLSCLPSAPWLRCPVISMLHVSKHAATPPFGTTALRAIRLYRAPKTFLLESAHPTLYPLWPCLVVYHVHEVAGHLLLPTWYGALSARGRCTVVIGERLHGASIHRRSLRGNRARVLPYNFMFWPL